ncbi:helix-turn-helix family protein [Clostridioides difficile CD160]|nr:helix-turn-helix family protein [Clostridioides difficile CD160]MDI0264714.1 helix-turn-helix transcriptional regulator [Clostridioides difficile]
MSNKKLENRLKELRKELNFTQEDISKKIGLSKSAYGYYEQGKTVPDAYMIAELSKIFNVSVDYLLGKTDIKSNNCSESLPKSFDNANDAIKFILQQPTLMAYGDYNIKKLSDEEVIDFANDLLQQIKLISFKYKK